MDFDQPQPGAARTSIDVIRLDDEPVAVVAGGHAG
jgi:hypothetical protein